MIDLLGAGVWRVPTARGDRDNAFLIESGQGLVLVDVGWKSAPSAIGAALTELRRAPEDISHIVITHAHPDHVRGLAEMAARSGRRCSSIATMRPG